ncbi:hypothetical protein XENOCAPTIV_002494 [Xenoophorus captivus]|uniref:Receptor L-domain domain-containing protein n=1 Tax=Xenoophorus captivus TaxID=1517983 RepID=A0ABV0Q509_9TELE
MSNQLTLLGTREYHYGNMKRMYSNCNIVLENLEITYTQEHQDLSFLEVCLISLGYLGHHRPPFSLSLQSIQEVGGYVLIAMNEVATIPLVNLHLIRGQNLYEGQYALLVMSNYNRNHSSPTLNYTSGLMQLQLSNLTGGSHLSGSRASLCSRGALVGSATLAVLTGRVGHPDRITARNVSLALFSCTTKHPACRDFNDEGTCKDTCPPPKIYDRTTHQVVNNPNTKYTFGAACVKSCPRNQYSFVVANVMHLQWLGLRSLKEVSAGNVILKNNPELCYTHTIKWSQFFRSAAQANRTNPDMCSEF